MCKKNCFRLNSYDFPGSLRVIVNEVHGNEATVIFRYQPSKINEGPWQQLNQQAVHTNWPQTTINEIFELFQRAIEAKVRRGIDLPSPKVIESILFSLKPKYPELRNIPPRNIHLKLTRMCEKMQLFDCKRAEFRQK